MMPNEYLRLIAQRYLMDEMLWPQIFELNRDVIRNPDVVRVGTNLRVPAASTDVQKKRVKRPKRGAAR